MVSEKSGAFAFCQIPPSVKINKMPGVEMLCRKDKLCKNYRKLQKQFGVTDFNFIPESFNIPEDLKEIQSEELKDVWFIMKPPAQSCGNGIKILSNVDQIPKRSKNIVVQRYLTNPFLIEGLKFDLRLYVLLTSVDPLRIYLYDDGLVRFATQEFSMKPRFLSDQFRHLTNFSVNKYNPEFLHNEEADEFYGHKRSFQSLLKYLADRKFNTENLLEEIKDIILKTIMTGYDGMVEAFKDTVRSDYNCYKLFGADVILDANLKPWVLEFNDFPSLGWHFYSCTVLQL